MADAEHRVVYKAFADFTALYAEVAKAKAAMAALKRETGSATVVDRSKEINQQRELNKLTRDFVHSDVKSWEELMTATRKYREELAKLNAERRQAAGGPGQLALPAGPRGTREQQLAADNSRSSMSGPARAMPSGLSDRDLASLRGELRGFEQQMGQLLSRGTGQFGSSPRNWPAGERNLFQNFANAINALKDEIGARRIGQPAATAPRLFEQAPDRAGAEPASGAGGMGDAKTHTLLTRILAAVNRLNTTMGRSMPSGAVGGLDPKQFISDQRSSAAADRARAANAAANAAEMREISATNAAAASAYRVKGAADDATAASNRKLISVENLNKAAAQSLAAEQGLSAATARKTVASNNAAASAERVKAATANTLAAEERKRSASSTADAAAERKRAASAAADATEARKRAAETVESIATDRKRQSAANAAAAELRLLAAQLRHAKSLADTGGGSSTWVDRLADRIRQAGIASGHVQRDFVTLNDVAKGVWKGIADGARDTGTGIKRSFTDARDGVSRASTAMGDVSRRTWIGISQDVSGSTRKVGEFLRGLVSVRSAVSRVGSIGDVFKFRNPSPPAGGSGGGGTGVPPGGSGALNAFADAGDRAAKALSGFLRHLFSMQTLITAAVVAAGPLIAVLGALGAAALGAGNVLVSLAGTLAAVPGLFTAVASGVGVLAVAMGPLSAVFQAHKAAQQQSIAAGEQAAASARREAQAAEAKASAIRNAELSYQAALKSVADAQYDAKKSQEDLNRARKDAVRDLQDMQMELQRASLNEESARLAVARAQEDYRKALADPKATILDRAEALNRLKQTEFDLRDVQLRNKRNQEDYNEALKKGVNGTDKVKDAQRNLANANYQVLQTQQRLLDAELDLAKARKQEYIGSTSANNAQQKYQEALDKLSPSTRKFAEAIFGLSGRWRHLQQSVSEKLFAPIMTQVGKFPGLLKTMEKFLGSSASAMGDLAAKGIKMVSSGPWKADFATIAKGNATIIARLGDAALHVADAFRNIIVAAQPFTTWLAGAIDRVAIAFDNWSKNARKSGAIAEFLADTKERLQTVWRIVKNVLSFFGSLYTATKDFGDYILRALEKITAHWAAVGKEQEKQGSGLRTWLQEVKPLLAAIGHFIGQVVTAFATLASDPKNIAEAQRILGILANDILPKLVEAFGKLSEHGVIGKILEAVGKGLDAINAAIDRTKGLPLDIVVWFLQKAADFLKWAFENPIGGNIIAA